jgi:hypothetical protein
MDSVREFSEGLREITEEHCAHNSPSIVAACEDMTAHIAALRSKLASIAHGIQGLEGTTLQWRTEVAAGQAQADSAAVEFTASLQGTAAIFTPAGAFPHLLPGVAQVLTLECRISIVSLCHCNVLLLQRS